MHGLSEILGKIMAIFLAKQRDRDGEIRRQEDRETTDKKRYGEIERQRDREMERQRDEEREQRQAHR
jgi:hypothetical protein